MIIAARRTASRALRTLAPSARTARRRLSLLLARLASLAIDGIYGDAFKDRNKFDALILIWCAPVVHVSVFGALYLGAKRALTVGARHSVVVRMSDSIALAFGPLASDAGAPPIPRYLGCSSLGEIFTENDSRRLDLGDSLVHALCLFFES